jgi:hypothetical protein
MSRRQREQREHRRQIAEQLQTADRDRRSEEPSAEDPAELEREVEEELRNDPALVEIDGDTFWFSRETGCLVGPDGEGPPAEWEEGGWHLYERHGGGRWRKVGSAPTREEAWCLAGPDYSGEVAFAAVPVGMRPDASYAGDRRTLPVSVYTRAGVGRGHLHDVLGTPDEAAGLAVDAAEALARRLRRDTVVACLCEGDAAPAKKAGGGVTFWYEVGPLERPAGTGAAT